MRSAGFSPPEVEQAWPAPVSAGAVWDCRKTSFAGMMYKKLNVMQQIRSDVMIALPSILHLYRSLQLFTLAC
jgi:hypothetical protein